MITQNTANSAIGLVEELDKRDIFLAPVEESPLERLVTISDPAPIEVPGIQPLDYTPSLEEIVTSSTNDLHTEELDAFGEQIAATVQNHLSFAKNIVKPAIEELVKGLETSFVAITEGTKLEADIKVYTLPAPMLETSFSQDILKFSDLPHVPVTATLGYEGDLLSSSEIVDLLKTSDTTLDAAIGSWAITQGDQFFIDNFESIIDPTKIGIQQRMETDLNSSIFAYLLATKLFNNPIDGFNDDLNTYNTKWAEIRNQSAAKIAHGYTSHRTNIDAGLLIQSYNSNEIIVNGDVYNSWIEQGGNNGAIYGSMLLNNPKVYVNDINANTVDLVERWNSNSRLVQAANKTREFLAKKQALSTALEKLVNDNFDAFYGNLVPEGSSVTRAIPEYAQYQVLHDQYINGLRESDFANVWDVCTNAVCDTVFYYTSAKQLLSGINEHMKNNPELTVREAILLSTIDYVVTFVCSQIEVTG